MITLLLFREFRATQLTKLTPTKRVTLGIYYRYVGMNKCPLMAQAGSRTTRCARPPRPERSRDRRCGNSGRQTCARSDVAIRVHAHLFMVPELVADIEIDAFA